MGKRKQVYSTDALTVAFDPDICIHSAVCLQGLPEVFDVSKKRWIRLENAETEVVAEVVKRCPSGALQCMPGESNAR